MAIYKTLGGEKFPLIEQTYYPNHKEMVSDQVRLPALLFPLWAQQHSAETVKRASISEPHKLLGNPAVELLSGTNMAGSWLTAPFLPSDSGDKIERAGTRHFNQSNSSLDRQSDLTPWVLALVAEQVLCVSFPIGSSTGDDCPWAGYLIWYVQDVRWAV